MAEFPMILGVYSLMKEEEIGTGATKTVKQQVTYWYVRQVGPTNFEVQPLNVFHVPSGIKKYLTDDDFLTQYVPEPNYYQKNTVPAMRTLYDKIRLGEEYFAEGQLDNAEKEFIKALMIDDRNVDANYGLGEVYTEKQEFDKLSKVLRTLMGLEEAFNTEHRQRLNSFGIRLRKNKCYDQAISFLAKALELNPSDDHAHFNLARSYFEKNDLPKCREHLEMALEINPGFVEARRFINYCDQILAESGGAASAPGEG